MRNGRIEILGFRSDSILHNVLPVAGTVVKRANLSGEKEWLLVELDEEFHFSESKVKYVFLKAKNDKPLDDSEQKQLAYFRIALEPIDESKDDFDKKGTRFIDWVTVKVDKSKLDISKSPSKAQGAYS